MAASKLNFRARTLDANRPMRVYYEDELPGVVECAPIARSVAAMPTGMEKEEEMESHLQDAIMAQQASTSGAAADNHVIPTPKVLNVDASRYSETYPCQPPPPDHYLKVQAWLSMEQEEAEYDLDSEDELYVRDKQYIAPKYLECIIALLELHSSESAICQPAAARKLLSVQYEDQVIDDVYDYWLNKRSALAKEKKLGFGGLIPRVRTECRKENAAQANPYVAFRRRAEKMQTRKNRKNDEESYEKVLRFSHDLRRSVHLLEMVKRREKTKMAIIDANADILRCRAMAGDYGSIVYDQLIAKMGDTMPSTSRTETGEVPLPLRDENGVKRKKVKRAKASRLHGHALDRELPNKAWLKKNAELWNNSPSSFITGITNVSPATEVDQSVAAASTANADGRYQFKRRRGCSYRAAVINKEQSANGQGSSRGPGFFSVVSMPSTSSADTVAMRCRVGRGGRVCFERYRPTKTSRKGYIAGRSAASSTVYDPFDDVDMDYTKTWSVKKEDEDETCVDEDVVSSRCIYSDRHHGRSMEDQDMDIEEMEDWLKRAVSPTPPVKAEKSTLPPKSHEMSPDDEMNGRTASSPPSESEEDGSTFKKMNNGGKHTHPIHLQPGGTGEVLSPPDSAAPSPHFAPAPNIDKSVASVDGWRESSTSPSESNSSADWQPPVIGPATRSSGGSGGTFAFLSSEEERNARTGDHPVGASKPMSVSPRKSNSLPSLSFSSPNTFSLTTASSTII